MNLMRILRHPRAAVVVHDLVMVAFAWLAAGWVSVFIALIILGFVFDLAQLFNRD